MTCYTPKFATEHWILKLNEKTGEIYPTKELKFLSLLDITEENVLKENCMIVPCGKCEGCRVDQANAWATRCYLEAQKWPCNAFLTLTYNNDSLPTKRTLIKADLQGFWKRLRKKIEPQQIRYMACGEYGPKTLRPHYHAVVFNYWPDDALPFKKNITGDFLYTSKTLERIWGKGFVVIGHVNYESVAYVARYVQKKAFGVDQLILKHGKTPEFRLSSRRPGIGTIDWTSKTGELIKRNFGVLIKTKHGVRLKPIPEFIRKKWRDLDDRMLYYFLSDQKRMRLRKEFAKSDTTDNYFQRLQKNIEILRKKLKILDKARKTV